MAEARISPALPILHSEDGILPLAQVVGMVFLLAGLGGHHAVPFHMWTLDVYEGAPTPMTAFFAAAPKLAGMAVFLRVVISAFPDALAAWQQIIIFISVASMVLGAFAAIDKPISSAWMVILLSGIWVLRLWALPRAAKTGSPLLFCI